MSKYRAALVCPHCRVVNVVNIEGHDKNFMKGNGTVNTMCFDCNKQITIKVKDVAYVKVD